MFSVWVFVCSDLTSSSGLETVHRIYRMYLPILYTQHSLVSYHIILRVFSVAITNSMFFHLPTVYFPM